MPDDATVVLESCPIPAEFEIKSITSKQTGTGAKTGVNQYQLDIDITLKGSSPIAPLKDSSLEVVFTSGSTEYTKNGESQNSDAAPYIASDGRTMVPLRFVAEALGAEVNWSSESRTATIELTGKTLNIQVDQQLPNDLGVAVISSDRLFVPVRYVSEELGAVVDWDEETQTITIKFS
ncbi:MAG: copper amine oxidase N-terminal domain-containing protein [Clostridiales bacterium]|nr:copper amine oxidase N-terminal domain-containing protein [Clostridiales bacterium]